MYFLTCKVSVGLLYNFIFEAMRGCIPIELSKKLKNGKIMGFNNQEKPAKERFFKVIPRMNAKGDRMTSEYQM